MASQSQMRVGSGVGYDSPVTAGPQTAATPSPQAGGFSPTVFAAASITDPELSRQRDSTPNGLGLSVAEKRLPPSSTHAPLGMGI